jgi:hypothetical protein
MQSKPNPTRRKNAVWVPVAVTVIANADGTLGKKLESESSYFNKATYDLDFSGLDMSAIVAFSLHGGGGYTFPSADECIEIRKAAGNTSSKPGKDVFKYIAVSDDGLLLVVVDDNPEESGKWRYTLFVRQADGSTVSIDPTIINTR